MSRDPLLIKTEISEHPLGLIFGIGHTNTIPSFSSKSFIPLVGRELRLIWRG
jgi:hypothetical protein